MSAPSLTQNQRAVKALEMARQKAQMEDETTARDLEMVKAPPESRPGMCTYVYATVIGLSCRYGIGRRKFSSSDVCFSLFELFWIAKVSFVTGSKGEPWYKSYCSGWDWSIATPRLILHKV